MAPKERVWSIPLPDGEIADHVRVDGPAGKRVWWRIGNVNGLGGRPVDGLPLYAADRLPDDQATTVVMCEGEPAADALLARNIAAVGTVTGAAGTPSYDSLAPLVGRSVIFWPDNDDPGREHMSRITDRLITLGAEDLRTVNWPTAPPKGDAADFSGDESELQALLSAATLYKQPAATAHEIPEPLSALLAAVRFFIRQYVVLNDPQADAIALWVVHSYVINAFDTTPYLSVTSAEKRSGKTRLLEVLEMLVSRPWLAGRITAAVLARKVDKLCPTLLLDESDAAFKGDKEYTETLRGMLNSGHRRSGKVTVCVVRGNNIDFQDFSTFCPKVIAGIGELPDTVSDRSIGIILKRRATGEPVKRFRYREAVADSELLPVSLASWASGAVVSLQQARPELPDALDDRSADNWEPLFAIADEAGRDWPARALRAAIELSADGDQYDQSAGVRLLADIAGIYLDTGVSQLPSVHLIERLNGIEESPWGDWRGKGLNVRSMAKMLKPFGVKPRTIRTTSRTPKGYRKIDFRDAWDRYVPSVAATEQQPESEPRTTSSAPTRESHVADGEPAEIGHIEPNVADVADRKPGHDRVRPTSTDVAVL